MVGHQILNREVPDSNPNGASFVLEQDTLISYRTG